MRSFRLPLCLLLVTAPVATALAQPQEPTPPVVAEEPPPPAPEPVEPAAVAEPTTVAEAEAAAEWSDPALEEDTGDSLQLHGWVSQGVLASTGNNYLAKSKSVSFEFFETGINITKEFGTDVRAGIQIFAQDLGSLGNYAPVIDLAYVDYKRSPGLRIKAGKFKMPLALHNERWDTDMTRTTVLAPQGVYDQHLRDVVNSIAGVGVYGTIAVGGAGSLDYDVYSGAVFARPSPATGATYDIDTIYGARLIWDAPTCLRAAAFGQYTNDVGIRIPLSDAARDGAIAAGAAPAGWDGILHQDLHHWKIVGSALECATENTTVTAEATWWDGEIQQSPIMAPPARFRELRAYAQAEHRLSDRMSSALYLSIYAQLDGSEIASEDARHQYDLAASFRYDLTTSWLIKAEVHALDGYGMTEAELNITTGERERRWGMLLAKTTLTF